MTITIDLHRRIPPPPPPLEIVAKREFDTLERWEKRREFIAVTTVRYVLHSIHYVKHKIFERRQLTQWWQVLALDTLK
jgi:predicted transcriptional regulator